MACATLHNLATFEDFLVETRVDGDEDDENNNTDVQNGINQSNTRISALLNYFR